MHVKLTSRDVNELERLLRKREKKEKTSVSLSREIVRAADVLAGTDGRSAFVERAIRRYLGSLLRRARNQRDLDAINRSADVTNREADEVIEFQIWPG